MAPLDNAAAPPSVDAQHPWLGLASFTEDTQAFFYGREEEVAELARRVQRKLLTLLFGQSGLGKTSILRAGILPRLRPIGYCPVYVRIDYSPESPPPSEQIKQAIFKATEQSGQWTQIGVANAGESLWEFLHHRDDVLRDAQGKTLTPLLIFDQFEEIFTLAQSDDVGRRRAAEFIEDLADLVENRPPRDLESRIEQDETAAERFDFTRSDYRVLIALREDYLAHLESLKGAMPSITQNRMRLARMTGEQALAAVVKPGGKLVSEEVAESIVRFIAGGSELRNAEVEPSLLSLICRELNNARIAKGRPEISADLLAGSHDTILAEFYERALADQPPAVRRFIEDELLTESGFRESIAEERVRRAFAEMGAPTALAKLVDRRLLRFEERLDVRRVELTHDVLCSVVRASRDLRHEREARDEVERKLAAQRASELATRKALVRARQVAAVCGVLAIGAIASALFGYQSMKRAQQAEAQAKETRAMAESARGEAEKLIVYLLDDFYLELEPVGRLDIVAALAKRAVDYYAGLPAELRSSETNRNRALALVRYGAALRTQSRLDESHAALSEAVDVLGKLRAGGDPSEATAVGLAIGLVSEARVAGSSNQIPDERRFADQAVDTLKPLMASARPSVTLRRAYGLALTYLGFAQVRTNEEESAVKTLEGAREAYRSIDGLELGDIPSAVAYAEASAWQVGALQSLGRLDEARQVAEAALTVTGQVLNKRPDDMLALRAEGLILNSIASVEWSDLTIRKTLELARRSVRDWETIVRIDPSNQVAWNNLVDSRMTVSGLLYSAADVREAGEQLRATMDIEQRVKDSGMIGNVLSLAAGYLARFDADTGNRQGAAAAMKSNQRFVALAVRGIPEKSFGGVFLPEFLGRYGFPASGIGYGAFALPYADGDYEAVRRMARESIGRMEQLKDLAPTQQQPRNATLELAYRTAADASYRLKDYVAADADMKRASALQKDIPVRTLAEKRDAGSRATLAAMIAARLGRYAEARQLIEPVLDMHRNLFARPGNEDLTQRVEFAQALYASALARSPTKGAELKQAAALIDALPPAMRALISVSRVRTAIADAEGS